MDEATACASRVDVVSRMRDGGEETVATVWLSGDCVLMTGSGDAIATIRHDVCGLCGRKQSDGEAFVNGVLEAYPPTVAVAYGAWCAVTRSG
jgi:hypothetical protein